VDILNEILAWAWARHHNLLSWYIRPLFIIPFCYFAYRRSLAGMGLTILALVTSMAWFPAPEVPDPLVLQFLAAEKEWLTGPWPLEKWLLSLTVPGFFVFLALAFWKRSWWYGVALINAAALGKVLWSVVYGGESGWAVLPPALVGLLLCNAAVFFGVRWLTRRAAPVGGPARQP
jgi:hypothetical protein